MCFMPLEGLVLCTCKSLGFIFFAFLNKLVAVSES